MSRAWSQQRARLFGAPGPAAESLVGRDLKRTRRRRHTWRVAVLPIFLGALAAALFLVALRNSIIRVRYDLDASRQLETALMERTASATVRLRELRDPTRLQQLAQERGFVRPEQVINLGLGAARP